MPNTHFFNYLACPKCHSSLEYRTKQLICTSCKREYAVIDDIPDFRDKEEYWCNVSREKMQELNKLARASGDWLGAALKLIPRYKDHFVPFDRADAQFLWPCTKDARILDAGSMWGGIAIPAAQYHGEVFAVDKTKETLEFLGIRAKHLGFHNIHTVAADLQHLPFPNNFFDLIALSGVLEWVALDEELVLEKHWLSFGRGLKTGKSVSYSENPRDTQLRVLRELQRILKPGGTLYLAIENRIGYIYLAGYPDDHMNIPFICFMPRFIANAVTKVLLGCEYRTYVYTIPQCRSLLKESGFDLADFFGAFTHYINPSEVIPLDLIPRFKEKIISSKKRWHRILLRCIPANLLKWVSPSIIVMATKGSRPNAEPRLLQLLKKSGVLSDADPRRIKLLKCASRPGNEHTVNYIVYDEEIHKPKYFCKICRDKELSEIISHESKNLKRLRQVLDGKEISACIPQLLFFGSIDAITFMVTEHIEARHSCFNFNSPLKYTISYLDKEIRQAIYFLAEFQKHTTTARVAAVPYLVSYIESKRELLRKRNLLTSAVESSVSALLEEIKKLKDLPLNIPLCAQHGDYDFFYNILFHNGTAKIVDFEHVAWEALPFLDLATLIANPLLVSYEHKKQNIPIAAILRTYQKHIVGWLDLHARLSGIPKELLAFTIPLAALEQRTREYPYYRRPETFPLNNAFAQLLAQSAVFRPDEN